MNAKVACLALLLSAGIAFAQGFAGLGTDAEGFLTPMPGPEFRFPRDHGAHLGYRIEWWYLTATLTDADGRDYGVQWTLFRSALEPRTIRGWRPGQIWMGHAGLTTDQAHFAAERFARGGLGQAGVTTDPFVAWIDDWAMTSRAEGGADALSLINVVARGLDFAYDLWLEAQGPPIFHGDGGFSVKSADGQASHYYSQPFYTVAGTLALPDGNIPVTGTAWLDREWSSRPLSPDQRGWDWFSLQFADGARMMGFGLRSDVRATFTAATWIAPDGTTTAYPDGALKLTPLGTRRVAGRQIPIRWRVELPARGVDVETAPLNPHSWMATTVPYWEGPIRFTGSHEGRGYLEMTGYE